MISPPGRILEVYNEGDNRIGLIEFDGRRRAIYLNLVPDAHVGDYVRFHAGFATERVVPPRPAEGAQAQPGVNVEYEFGEADLAVLQASHLLSELDPDQLHKLLPLAQDKSFSAGEIIFRADEKSLFLHLIVSGDVALEEVSGHQAVTVQTLHAGDAMGWSALTADARTHFQARALTPVATIAFPGDKLGAVCDRDPTVGYALMKRLVEMLSERLDAMRMRLAEFGNPMERR